MDCTDFRAMLEFCKRDDCLDAFVPSDLRLVFSKCIKMENELEDFDKAIGILEDEKLALEDRIYDLECDIMELENVE
jgi:hypothetical protein